MADLFPGKPFSATIDGRTRWAEMIVQNGGNVVPVNSAHGCLAGEVKAGDPKMTAARLLEQIIRTKQASARSKAPPRRR